MILLASVGSAGCDLGQTADSSVRSPAGSEASAHANGSAGNQGTGGATVKLTLKQPIDRGDGKLVLEFGSTYFEVDPGHGARISSLRQAGQELLVLTGASNYADALGSTFWPSPQSWPWPPPAEIDNLAYAATVDESGAIALQGQANLGTSLQVSKRFSANLAREALELDYSMTNIGTAPVQWAPWEITRMPATGLAFWPTGGEPFGDRPLATEAALGHTWCTPSQSPGEAKVFADGAGGYLAYLLGDRLLIKQFQDQPASAAAPGEAEVELYVNEGHDYLELENQGAYVSIAPGETLAWRVVWYVRQLPAGAAGPTREDLVAFVAKTLE
jgi:hypothetical protein